MTHKAQIKALAELDGWKYVPERDSLLSGSALPFHWEHENDERAWCYEDYPSNYLHSYDAILPLVQKQPIDVQQLACELLQRQQWFYILCAPSQICEALLRATGKWTE